MADELPGFMRIPSEIRFMIYDLLFDDRDQKTFEIRNEDPEVYELRTPHQRAQYHVLGRDLMRRSRPTTYHLVTDTELHPSILRVNRRIYEESKLVLYGNRSFSFDRDIEAIVPFFTDLSESTRAFVQDISLVKQGSVYAREYDRCEWSNVCEFLRNNMRLSGLKIVVEGGRPALGWEGLPVFTMEHFNALQTMQKVQVDAQDPLEWVWELLTIKGIRNLDIGSEIHHCPPLHSSAVAFFAAFSASIETGFADFLRSKLCMKA